MKLQGLIFIAFVRKYILLGENSALFEFYGIFPYPDRIYRCLYTLGKTPSVAFLARPENISTITLILQYFNFNLQKDFLALAFETFRVKMSKALDLKFPLMKIKTPSSF